MHHRGDPVEVDGKTWDLVRYFIRYPTFEEYEEVDGESLEFILVVHLIEPPTPSRADELPIPGPDPSR